MLKIFAYGAMACLLAAAMGCSKIKQVTKVTTVVVKDIPIEQQLSLQEKYLNRHAWTRDVIEDLTERVETANEPRKRTVPRDAKVTVVDINLVYSGSVTIEDPKGKRIVAALNCERPLTVERVESKLGELFWFDDPVIRQVNYIRKWGKKIARSVINHEIVAGMPVEAARESWGVPDEVRASAYGTEGEVQWVYKLGKRNKSIFVVKDVVGRFED